MYNNNNNDVDHHVISLNELHIYDDDERKASLLLVGHRNTGVGYGVTLLSL